MWQKRIKLTPKLQMITEENKKHENVIALKRKKKKKKEREKETEGKIEAGYRSRLIFKVSSEQFDNQNDAWRGLFKIFQDSTSPMILPTDRSVVSLKTNLCKICNPPTQYSNFKVEKFQISPAKTSVENTQPSIWWEHLNIVINTTSYIIPCASLLPRSDPSFVYFSLCIPWVASFCSLRRNRQKHYYLSW